MNNQRQYYFDRLPIHPQPQRLESLTSYLIRLAEANHIRSLSNLAPLCIPLEKLREMRDVPPASLGILPTAAGCSMPTLQAMTFHHWGRKFGRKTASAISFFLSSSIAEDLRYCPLCLTECSCYSLTWRFLSLQGCKKHACRLLNTCGHCNKFIPLFKSPLGMAICPWCRGDLRTCRPLFLSERELLKVLEWSCGLEFLLSAQLWEESIDNIAQRLGQQFTLLRGAKSVSPRTISREARITPKEVGDIEQVEYGFGGSTGPKFQRYLSYATYLRVSMQDLFQAALFQEVESEEPGVHLREEDVVERVQDAVDKLKARGEAITEKAISKMVQLTRLRLRSYPGVKVLLEGIARELRAEKDERAERDRSEAQEKVEWAVNQLKASGVAITQTAVAEMSGLDPSSLRACAAMVEVMQQSERDQQAREGELVAKVEAVIRELEEHGQRVTQRAIISGVRVTYKTLMNYPPVQSVLREVRASYHRSGQVRLDENELLAQAEALLKQREALGKISTHEIARRELDITASTLRSSPRVVLLLKQEIYRQRENELVSKVLEAIQRLKLRGERATVMDIAGEVPVRYRTLLRYPKVRALLEQVKGENRQSRQQGSPPKILDGH